MFAKHQKHTVKGRKATFTNHTKYSIDFMTWSAKGATPDELARYGFYYDPIKAHIDRIMCFCCKRKEIDWAPNTSKTETIPIEQSLVFKHHHNSPSCEYASILSAKLRSTQVLNYDWSHDEIFKEVERSAYIRLRTFRLGKSPFTKSKSELPTPEKFAANGFFYMPSGDSEYDDQVECMYCNTSLEGWESGDDVEKEHRKTNPNCYVFHYNSILNSERTPTKTYETNQSLSFDNSVFQNNGISSTVPSFHDLEEHSSKGFDEPLSISETPIATTPKQPFTEKITNLEEAFSNHRFEAPSVLVSSPVKPQSIAETVEIISKNNGPSRTDQTENKAQTPRRSSIDVVDQVRLQEELVELDDFENLEENTQVEEVDIPLSTLDELDSLFFVEGSSHRPSTFFNRSRTHSALPSSAGNRQEIKSTDGINPPDEEAQTLKLGDTNTIVIDKSNRNISESKTITNYESVEREENNKNLNCLKIPSEPDTEFQDYETLQDYEEPEMQGDNSLHDDNMENEIEKEYSSIDSEARRLSKVTENIITVSSDNNQLKTSRVEEIDKIKNVVQNDKSDQKINGAQQVESKFTDSKLKDDQLPDEQHKTDSDGSNKERNDIEQTSKTDEQPSENKSKKRKNLTDITNKLESFIPNETQKLTKRSKKNKKSRKLKEEKKLQKIPDHDNTSKYAIIVPIPIQTEYNEINEPPKDVTAVNFALLSKKELSIDKNLMQSDITVKESNLMTDLDDDIKARKAQARLEKETPAIGQLDAWHFQSETESPSSPVIPTKRLSTDFEKEIPDDSSSVEGKIVHKKVAANMRQKRLRKTSDGKTIPSDDLLSFSSKSSGIKRRFKKRKTNLRKLKQYIEDSDNSNSLDNADSSDYLKAEKKTAEIGLKLDPLPVDDTNGNKTLSDHATIKSSNQIHDDIETDTDFLKHNSIGVTRNNNEVTENKEKSKGPLYLRYSEVNTSNPELDINANTHSKSKPLKVNQLENQLEDHILLEEDEKKGDIEPIKKQAEKSLEVPANEASDFEQLRNEQSSPILQGNTHLKESTKTDISNASVNKNQYEDSDDEVLLENHEVEPMQSRFTKPMKYAKQPSNFIKEGMALLPPADSDYELEPQTSPLATKGNKHPPSSPGGVDAVLANSYESTIPDEYNKSNQRLASSEAFLLQNKSCEINSKAMQKTPTSASLSLAFSSLSRAQSTPQALIKIHVDDIKSSDDLDVDADNSKQEDLLQENDGKDADNFSDNTEVEAWVPIDNSKLSGHVEEINSVTNYMKNILDSKYESLHDDMDGKLTNFISEMPVEELGMTIKDWIYYQAEQGSNLIETKGKLMLKEFRMETERALKVLENIPTTD